MSVLSGIGQLPSIFGGGGGGNSFFGTPIVFTTDTTTQSYSPDGPENAFNSFIAAEESEEYELAPNTTYFFYIPVPFTGGTVSIEGSDDFSLQFILRNVPLPPAGPTLLTYNFGVPTYGSISQLGTTTVSFSGLITTTSTIRYISSITISGNFTPVPGGSSGTIIYGGENMYLFPVNSPAPTPP